MEEIIKVLAGVLSVLSAVFFWQSDLIGDSGCLMSSVLCCSALVMSYIAIS